VFSPVAVDVIVDLQGAFVPGEGGQRYAPLDAPSRLVDTRGGEVPTRVVVSIPGAVPHTPNIDDAVGPGNPGASIPDVTAVTVNLTAVAVSGEGGYLSAYPCDGATPGVSNVNFGPGETVAGSAYVPVDANATICVAVTGAAHVLVDLTGTFGATGTLLFTPATPTRVLDTRNGAGGWIGRLRVGQRISTAVVPAGAVAVTGTLTAVNVTAAGFLSAAATLPDTPTTSNLNVGASATIANSVTTGVRADGSLDVYSSTAADVLVDVTGWWS
jgi:hypothetical protein